MSNEAWFAFSQKGGQGRFLFGWGTESDANKYADHLDLWHGVDDETRQHIWALVADEERAELDLDTRLGDTINLADALRDVLDDLDDDA